ncbi:Protein of uncharacterised function (DUF3575) [Bacteroides uniformis]|uniref:Protein of uncharacterized function (DUF3575) n=1 Tax=Bacteroides uniformis TaxID=820 RepID=A0A174S4Y5_BACUN|nr:DUF3575 domain-containing protein [Bacteroides uniformis]CUP91007.1 Protein of uncharacterised function (DUF3575) [Bacteroides uniformis]
MKKFCNISCIYGLMLISASALNACSSCVDKDTKEEPDERMPKKEIVAQSAPSVPSVPSVKMKPVEESVTVSRAPMTSRSVNTAVASAKLQVKEEKKEKVVRKEQKDSGKKSKKRKQENKEKKQKRTGTPSTVDEHGSPKTVQSVQRKDFSPKSKVQTKERYFALKTNLAGWGVGAMNIAAEAQIDSHLSLELPLYYAPWKLGNRHALQQFTVQPEFRYWFEKPGQRHFVGMHLMASWYNFRWNRYRYQDTEALWGVGLSYGYKLPLSVHWGMEFALGAGYMRTHYDKFYNVENGILAEQASKSIWGITRLGLSFVYCF